MDENVHSSDLGSNGTSARARGLRFIRSRLLAMLVVSFAVAGGFHGIERHVDHQLAERDKVICKDLKDLNSSRPTALQIKLKCDDR